MNTDLDVLRLRDSQLFWREVNGEIVVLDGQKWEYLKLNESGKLLWSTLVEGATVAQLVAKLVETYGIDNALAATDVNAFLERLLASELLAA